MRFRYMLPATLLVAGSAFAQAGATNALGIWDSEAFGFFGWFIGTGYPAGTAGNSMWQTLPPEITTHFNAYPGNSRTMAFRGYEMNVTHFNAAVPAYNGPRIQIRDTVPNGASPQRWLPGPLLFANFPSVVGLIPGGTPAGTTYRVGANVVGPAVNVTAGGPAGVGIAVVWQDFMMTLGDGNDLHIVSTSLEPGAGGAAAISYSGGSVPTQNFILPNGFAGAGTSGEWVITILLENAAIQPVKNTTLISAGGSILGGGAPPAPFAARFNDGRGAIHPVAGDAVSYNGNSRLGNPVQGSLGTTYFAPFVLYSGDLAFGPAGGGPDPLSEAWNSGLASADNTGVQTWVNDFCGFTAACPTNTGQVLNPANSSWAMWEGLHFAVGQFNINVLLNGLAYADISSGPQWAGPATVCYDAAAAPLGLLGRNLATTNGYLGAGGAPINGVHEHRTLLNPQAGYTPVAGGATLPGGQFGFGVYGGGLAGQFFQVQCWMISIATNTIDDMTNVGVMRLQ
jgi:hypothetical protein